VSLHAKSIEVCRLEHVEGLKGEVIDLFRDPDKSIYPEDEIIPMRTEAR
jgi:hypothetical protein